MCHIVMLPTMPDTESIKCLLIDRQFPQPEDHQIGTFKGGASSVQGVLEKGSLKSRAGLWTPSVSGVRHGGQAKPLASGWPLEGGRGRAASQRWEHVLGVS